METLETCVVELDATAMSLTIALMEYFVGKEMVSVKEMSATILQSPLVFLEVTPPMMFYVEKGFTLVELEAVSDVCNDCLTCQMPFVTIPTIITAST